MDYTNMQIGTDLSVYEPKVDYQLLKNSGVKYIIARAGKGNYMVDNTFNTHNQGTVDAQLPFGFYWVHDPMISPLAQYNYMANVIADHKINFACLDVEIHSYLNNGVTTRIDPFRISDTTREMVSLMMSRLNMPVVMYTRRTFVDEYAGPISTWAPGMDGLDLWLAYYPYSTSLITTTWDNIKSTLPTAPNEKYLRLENATRAKYFKFWQINDKFVLPGIYTATNMPTPTDVNVFDGDIAQWCNFSGTIPPVEQDTTRLENLEVRVLTLEQKVNELLAKLRAV